MVTLERNKDVNQNVTLDRLDKHLDSIYANSLPEGVTIDGNQSKTLLAGDTSEGFITLKANKTAPPCEKQLGVVMVIFFELRDEIDLLQPAGLRHSRQGRLN
jgi:hypothetical protein